MYTSKITGLGYFVPENIVTNEDLSKLMDTNDEWIQERTGIKERRWIKKGSGETSEVSERQEAGAGTETEGTQARTGTTRVATPARCRPQTTRGRGAQDEGQAEDKE